MKTKLKLPHGFGPLIPVSPRVCHSSIMIRKGCFLVIKDVLGQESLIGRIISQESKNHHLNLLIWKHTRQAGIKANFPVSNAQIILN